MISRRPNRRASTENAPGPSIIIASRLVSARIAGTSDGKRVFVQLGIKENPMARAHNPVSMPARGVKKPTSRRKPAIRPAAPASQVPAEAADSFK